MNIEIEVKLELSESDFRSLQRQGTLREERRQINVYYDAQWLLADQAVTLRIRFAEALPPVLTLKIPISHDAKNRKMKEYEWQLDRPWSATARSSHPMHLEPETDLPAEIADELRNIGVRRLDRIGWVRNTRSLIEFANDGLVELDELRLPNGDVVFEAEIESADDGSMQRLTERIRSFVPAASLSMESKFQRFRKACEERE